MAAISLYCAKPPHELSKVVYVYSFQWGSDYIGRISQRFHVRRDQQVTKKAKIYFWLGINTQREQSVHEQLLNNPNCAENYNECRFSIIYKARFAYQLCVLESLLIKTLETKNCKQFDVYNLKLYK